MPTPYYGGAGVRAGLGLIAGRCDHDGTSSVAGGNAKTHQEWPKVVVVLEVKINQNHGKSSKK